MKITAKDETFTAYLRRQLDRHGPVGDLARDAFHMPPLDWPAEAKTFEEFDDHLMSHNACDGAVDALRDAWHEWSGEVPSY